MWPFRPGGLLGRRGERLAAAHLRAKGFRILARNYRCPTGEADIIALDPAGEAGNEALVFVEVKTRRHDDHAAPESAVDRRKRQRLLRVARYYLACHDTAGRPVRFDVVSVVLRPAEQPDIRHIPGAFQ